jgi:hypothetical protein
VEEKEKWIINYLINNSIGFVDILDEDFVMAFIDKFGAKCVDNVIGAPKCKELSNLLSQMYRNNKLNRFAHGVRSGLCQDGKFPKWVYSYTIKTE